jgi:hypothetical protein
MDHDLNLKTAVVSTCPALVSAFTCSPSPASGTRAPAALIHLDVLSFLKHTDVERYRLVSHHSNSTVVQLRDQLHLANRRVFSDFKLRRMVGRLAS